MKIQFDLHGATPLQPDYALLCAGLLGVQAASPTALAETAMPCLEERSSALIDLFAWPIAADRDVCASASFNLAVARLGIGEER